LSKFFCTFIFPINAHAYSVILKTLGDDKTKTESLAKKIGKN
jgi:hypothetical protein